MSRRQAARRGDLVEVQWEDATADSDWVSDESYVARNARCTSVGYVVRLTRNLIALASTWSPALCHIETLQWNSVGTIPRPWVTHIKVLRQRAVPLDARRRSASGRGRE